MRTIAIYEANDGTRFDKEADAMQWDSLLADVEQASRPLRPRPDSSSFDAGESYVQQSRVDVAEFKRRIVEIGKRLVPHPAWNEQDVHPFGIIGRILSDSRYRPLDSAWYRLQCMDDRFREWGQPYYARNPNLRARST